MKIVHTECFPDETLLKVLGFTRKSIVHHYGKSRVYGLLSKKKDQTAMVDEDPGHPNHPYHRMLTLKEEIHDVKYFVDTAKGNKVFVLNIKLEDWILQACKKSKIKPEHFGLPATPNMLHDSINFKLGSFERLVRELLEIENEGIIQLKRWLIQ